MRAAPPNSRRDAAATVHANGAADGPSPEPPEANHANRFEPTPRTPPAAAAARGAVITGADATAGTDTCGALSTIGADEPTGSPTGTTDSEVPAERSPEPASITPGCGFTPVAPTPGAPTPGPAEPERRLRGLSAPAPPEPLRTPDGGVTAGESLSAEPEDEELAEELEVEGVDEPPDPRPPGTPPTESADADPARPGRPLRDGTDGFVAPADEDESDDPDDPPDPVVSANATGTDATAEPTPNATASAPTRPT